MITDFFRGYGEILESQVIRDRTGHSKGCAFVKFASMTKAEDAKRLIENKKIVLPGAGHSIQIRWAEGEDQRLGVEEDTVPKLFVGSLPKHATEVQIFDQLIRIRAIGKFI